MNIEEIKQFHKQIEDLQERLTDIDKETFDFVIYGCNQCAKMLAEKETIIKGIKEYILLRKAILEDVAVVDDGTYSVAKETFNKIIDVINKNLDCEAEKNNE